MELGENLSFWPFILQALFLSLCLSFGFYYFNKAKQTKNKKLAFVIFLLSSAITIPLLPFLNKKMPTQSKRYVSTELDFEKKEVLNEGKDTCFKVVPKENVIPKKLFCDPQYTFQLNDFEIVYEFSKGILGVEVLTDLYVKKYHSRKEFFEHYKDQSDIRFADMSNFLKLHGKHSMDDFKDHWLNECENKKISSCRLAAYILIINQQRDKIKFLLTKACTSGDLTACVSYAYNPEFSKADIKQAERMLRSKIKPN